MKKLLSTLFLVFGLGILFSANLFADFTFIKKVTADYYATKIITEFIPINNCSYTINNIERYGYRQKIAYTKRYTNRLEEIISVNYLMNENPNHDLGRTRDFIFQNKISDFLYIPKDGYIKITYTFNSINGAVLSQDIIHWSKKANRVKRFILPKKIPLECSYDPYKKRLFSDRTGRFLNGAKQRGKSFLNHPTTEKVKRVVSEKWNSPKNREMRKKVKEIINLQKQNLYQRHGLE